MTRMGKLFLAVLVLMLTCSPAIGAETSASKDKGPKWIKIYFNEQTGIIEAVKHKGPSGEVDAKVVAPPHAGIVVGTITFHHSSPGCIDIVIGGHLHEYCW